MAFSGTGKARREPCAKCGLPVFIAERLNVGKHLYHRTCFRCARCNSQLTLANYYETENGDFCCEICPDEEKVATKPSPEKSVLLRSMSDEEKTASLKTFSNEPDNYSTMFETALENIHDDNQKRDFAPAREGSSEFFKARSQFIQSQMEESSDSGNEDEPPDLPKSTPPKLDRDELTPREDAKVKDALVLSSDSGFPNNRLKAIANPDNSSVSNRFSKTSVELEKTHNIVTKDKPAAEGDTSLVRARMRLFESNNAEVNEFRKSDLNKNSQNTFRVPLKSPTSPLSPKESIKKSAIPIVKLEDLENFEQLSKQEFRDDVTSNTDNRHTSEVSITLSHNDDTKHSCNNITNKYVEELDDSNVSVSIPSDKEKNEDTIEKDRKIETSPVSVEEKELKDGKDESVRTESPLGLNETRNHVIIEDLSSTRPTQEDSPVTPIPENNDQSTEVSLNQVSETEHEQLHEKQDVVKNESPPKQEADYPEDLNPFGDDEEPQEQKKANISLNPFEDDEDDDEEERGAVSKPVPSPRLKKKIFPTDADKEIMGTPEHLSGVHIQRINVNPFESDDDEPSWPPVPAARKRKVIKAPEISLNPFESEDEENEEDTVKQPVPKPRTSVGR